MNYNVEDDDCDKVPANCLLSFRFHHFCKAESHHNHRQDANFVEELLPVPSRFIEWQLIYYENCSHLRDEQA